MFTRVCKRKNRTGVLIYSAVSRYKYTFHFSQQCLSGHTRNAQFCRNCNFACGFVGSWNLFSCVGVQRRLTVVENRVEGKIFGPKSDRVTGEWRRLHNEELHNLNSPLPDKKNREWDGQGVWHVWGSRKMHTGFGRKIKGRRKVGLA